MKRVKPSAGTMVSSGAGTVVKHSIINTNIVKLDR